MGGEMGGGMGGEMGGEMDGEICPKKEFNHPLQGGKRE